MVRHRLAVLIGRDPNRPCIKNHIFRGTRIDRSITARDISRLFRAWRTKEFLHRSSWSKYIGTASETLNGISRSGRL